MSPKDFRKICHPEAKILNSLVNCAHSDGQTVRTRCRADPTSSGSSKNQNYLENVYQSPENVSKKFQQDISSRTGDIPLYSFGKEVSKQTD